MPRYRVLSDYFYYDGVTRARDEEFETTEYIYSDDVILLNDSPSTRVVLAHFTGAINAGDVQEIIINWGDDEIGVLFLAVDGEIKLHYNGNETAQFKDCNIVHRISANMVRKVVIEAITDSNIWLAVLREAR
ncbi:MAG TPA: hypothetical protein ENF81_05770 [Thermotogaceae bacterium]|nr:hypothetical protein [Thermotogaceae bacterium]